MKKVCFLAPFFVGITRISDFIRRTDIEMVPIVARERVMSGHDLHDA